LSCTEKRLGKSPAFFCFIVAALPTFISLPEAARKYGLYETRIKSLIESGAIKAAMIGETIVVSESDAQGGGNSSRSITSPAPSRPMTNIPSS
jgi:hypothetical protein